MCRIRDARRGVKMSVSAFPEDLEVLLPPGTLLRRVSDGTTDAGGERVVELEVVYGDDD